MTSQIEKYGSELLALTADNAGFDALIAKLRSDRTIRQPEMRQIAIGFLGYEIAKSRPRKYALQQIIDRQMIDARQKARGCQIDRMHAW